MSNFSLSSTPAHPARNHVEALDGLQRDMLDALHADQVKQQLNDAKIRAVKQRVEYDDFEKLVAGAHLRPIKPRSQTLDEVGKAFDGFVLPKHDAAPAASAPPPKAAALPEDSVPPPAKTSNEFSRVWRRQCKTPAVRRAYLRQLDPDTLPLIFRTELDPALFDGIVGTLGEACLGGGGAEASGGDATANAAAAAADLAELDGAEEAGGGDAAAIAELAWAGALLQGIARLNRFDLTIDFADKATIETLAALVEAMAAANSPDAEALAALRAAYKV